MELPLVVGVDGSDGSLLAVDWAADEAARHGPPLRVVHASPWERYEESLPTVSRERSSQRVLAEHIAASAAERAQRRHPDLKVSADTLPADAVSALLRESENASVLVTGSRGRGAVKGALLGSVGLEVAARSACPVVVVRGDQAGLAGTHERVLLGLKDLGTSTEAVWFAFREAEARDGELDVVHAVSADPAEQAAGGDKPSAAFDTLVAEAAAEHPRVRVRRTTVAGPAGKVLADRSAAADLVVVGARRDAGTHRLGGVPRHLLHHAACPVAVVPQRA
ncbi:universal stress protein [Streptomyces sp. NPDC127063]|uniref:universal stress protein n=1 Tax=Streptomyces sp. NPDC127063 TaxID=3347123 RepID=UPI0036559502